MTAVVPHAAATEWVRRLPNTLTHYTGFAEVIGALAKGHPASFDGVWGSACALVTAALAAESKSPLVVVLPTEREADDAAADLELFTGQEPQFYPSWETAPDERLVHDETFGERLRVLKRLLSGVRSQESGVGGHGTGDTAGKVRVAPSTGLGRYIKAHGKRMDEVPSAEYQVLGAPTSAQDQNETATSSLIPHPSSRILVTSIQALLQPSPRRSAIAAATRVLRRGERVDIEEFLRWLVERGFHATSAVELPGEFSHRGGILDIFAPDWLLPVRVELFDDEIESLRTFEVGTQRSHDTLDEIDVTVLRSDAFSNVTASAESVGHLSDYLPSNSSILLVDPDRITDEGRNYLQRVDKPGDFHSVQAVLAECSRFAVATTAEIEASTAGVHCHLPFESVERFSGDIGRIRDELDTIAHADEVFIISPTEAEVERLREILAPTKLAATGRLHYPIGTLHAGFRLGRGEQGASTL